MKVSSNFLKFSHVQGGSFSVLHNARVKPSEETNHMGRKYSKQNVSAIEENNVSWYHLQSFTEATECHSKLSSALFQVTHS